MIFPHTEEGKLVQAWIVCSKCNGSYHRVLPGIETPYWWCQDEKCQLREGQEIEVQYLEEE